MILCRNKRVCVHWADKIPNQHSQKKNKLKKSEPYKWKQMPSHTCRQVVSPSSSSFRWESWKRTGDKATPQTDQEFKIRRGLCGFTSKSNPIT